MRRFHFKRFSWRKGVIWLLIGLLTLLLILVTALVLILGTQSGRLWLLDTGVDMGLGDGPIQVTFEGARSPGLGEWSFERIRVKRQQDIWLDIHKLNLRWQPRELLQKRILINNLSAEQLDVNLAAEPLPEKEEEPASDGGGLPPIAVQAFALDRLRLLNEAGDIPPYQISGDLQLFWDSLPFQINLLAESIPESDQHTPMRLAINSSALSPRELRLQGSLVEHPGGQLGQLLRLPSGSGIDAEFAGILTQTRSGYELALERLQLPFLQRQLGAAGTLSADNEFQHLQIEQLTLSTDERQHQLSGEVSADRLELQLVADEFPLDLLSPWVEQLEHGTLTAQVRTSGKPTDPRIVGSLSATTEYQGQAVALNTAGTFSRQQLNFDRLTFNFGISTLRADGRLDLEGVDTALQFQLDNFPTEYLALANVELPAEFSGRITSAKGRIAGDYRNPSGQLTASAKGQFRQQPFSVNLDAQGDRQRVSLASARLLMGDAHLSAEGLLDLEGDQSNLNLDVAELPLELLELAEIELPAHLLARISGAANIQGTLDSPQVSGEMRANGSYRDQAFTATLHGSGNRERVVIRRAQARVGDASVDADGTVNLTERTANLEVALDNASLDLLELALIEKPDDLTAEFSGWASLTGSFDKPQIDSQLQATGSYQDLPFVLVANGSLLDRRLQLDRVQLDLNDVTALEITGYLQPDSYDLRLVANNLPTQTFSALGWDLVTGEFNADFRVQGTPDAPDIDGELLYSGNLSGLDLASGERTTFDLGWHTQLVTEEQILYISSNFTRNQVDTGSLQVTLPITEYLTHFDRGDSQQKLPLVFNAEGAADLTVLSLVLDPDIHRIEGRAAFRLESQGTLARPDLQGTIELINGRYENSLSGTLLSEVELLLKSSGSRITIAEARALGGSKGRIEAEGWIDWLEIQRDDAINIGVTARHVNFINREDLDGDVSGELSLTGSFQELWLKGELDVTPFAANIEAALQNEIPEIEVTEVYGDPDEVAEENLAASITPTVHLDLTITAEQQAFLRGRGLEAELAGEIHLGGTLAEPHYEGEFNIVRGVFEVFGRKFTLLQGQVLFANNALYMLIPGEYQQDEYTIRAELSGTVEDLSLSLTSVPSLPEDEILSRLIFGKSAQNITPFQAIRLAGAIQTLRGGGGGFDPVGSTRDVLGVDTLSIESASTETGTGVAIGVGKYINERVYLEVKRTPSEIQAWQGSVQIELTSRLHLRSTVGGEGRTGAELLWRRDY